MFYVIKEYPRILHSNLIINSSHGAGGKPRESPGVSWEAFKQIDNQLCRGFEA
jgi:hypothetical protein